MEMTDRAITGDAQSKLSSRVVDDPRAAGAQCIYIADDILNPSAYMTAKLSPTFGLCMIYLDGGLGDQVCRENDVSES